MKNFKQKIQYSSLILAMSITAVQASSSTFNGMYFSQSDRHGIAVSDAILQDDDLVRGNGSDEFIFRVRSEDSRNINAPLPLFNGVLIFDRVNFTVSQDDGEVSTTVFFNDGTSMDQVLGIFYRSGGRQGLSSQLFLLDHNALVSAGKTLNDISGVRLVEYVDHNLDYSDLGFRSEIDAPLSIPDAPTIEPEPEENEYVDPSEFNLVLGSSGRDRLVGTSGADIINGRGGSRDVLIGRGGKDFFIFGAEAGNYIRNRDIIRDFNVNEDTLVLENGVKISFVRERNRSIIIRLEGADRDVIKLRNMNADFDSINVLFQEGTFEPPS